MKRESITRKTWHRDKKGAPAAPYRRGLATALTDAGLETAAEVAKRLQAVRVRAVGSSSNAIDYRVLCAVDAYLLRPTSLFVLGLQSIESVFRTRPL